MRSRRPRAAAPSSACMHRKLAALWFAAFAVLLAILPSFARDITAIASGKPGPSLRLIYPSEAAVATAKLTVEAVDPSGVAEIEIVERAHQVRYQTGASGTGPIPKFTRAFLLSEIFPAAPPVSGTVRLEVTVKNTKNQSVSATAVIRLEKMKKEE